MCCHSFNISALSNERRAVLRSASHNAETIYLAATLSCIFGQEGNGRLPYPGGPSESRRMAKDPGIVPAGAMYGIAYKEARFPQILRQ
jgi:hypothetical protein